MNDDLYARNAAQTVSEADSFTPHRYRQFARHLGGSSRVLDVGCNTGRGGAELRRAFPRVRLEGVDMLASRVSAIPSGIYDALTVGDVGAVASTGSRFDAVVMGEVIEHVPYPLLADFIGSTFELLESGGLLLLTTPNPHYVLLRWRGGSVLGGPHVSVHCPVALRQLLDDSGFRVVRVEGTGRVSQLVGCRLPLMLYGSYMLIASRTTR